VSDTVYMAWRYLARHRVKTAILVVSIALIVFIPIGLRVLVQRGEAQLTARAEVTPLILGAKGSPLELVLSSLYFAAEVPETILHGAVDEITASGLARPIPLSVRFRAGDHPIVGTTLDYFEFRGLRVAEGRQVTRLGDCVVGAEVARRRDLAPGDFVVSSPESVFDLAGVYPLKMKVSGVLGFTGTPDDHAVFVDVRTVWIIEGLGHGHQDLDRPEAVGAVLSREGGRITANASVVQYNQITDENIDSFHFHGDLSAFPITAVIADPVSPKSATLLLGRYESGETLQVARPRLVMDELLATILTVQNVVVAALVSVAIATLATTALVFLLSLRLRRREIQTMIRIGGARHRVAAILVCEVVGVLAAAVVLAGALTWATDRFGSEVIQTVIMRS
jgi:putative ABC transport system permease protein